MRLRLQWLQEKFAFYLRLVQVVRFCGHILAVPMEALTLTIVLSQWWGKCTIYVSSPSFLWLFGYLQTRASSFNANDTRVAPLKWDWISVRTWSWLPLPCILVHVWLRFECGLGKDNDGMENEVHHGASFAYNIFVCHLLAGIQNYTPKSSSNQY